MNYTAPTLIAGGNIAPARLIKVSSGAGVQADANALAIGVSAVMDRDYSGATRYAASSGDALPMQDLNGVVFVEAGGSFSTGDLLKSDGDGKAVAAALTGTTLQNVALQALEDGAAGKITRCRWNLFKFIPALT